MGWMRRGVYVGAVDVEIRILMLLLLTPFSHLAISTSVQLEQEANRRTMTRKCCAKLALGGREHSSHNSSMARSTSFLIVCDSIRIPVALFLSTSSTALTPTVLIALCGSRVVPQLLFLLQERTRNEWKYIIHIRRPLVGFGLVIMVMMKMLFRKSTYTDRQTHEFHT